MNIRYIVIDEADKRTVDRDGNPEAFHTFDAAVERAKTIAFDNAGDFIGVYGLAAEAIAPRGEIEVRRVDQPEEAS